MTAKSFAGSAMAKGIAEQNQYGVGRQFGDDVLQTDDEIAASKTSGAAVGRSGATIASRAR